MNYTNHINYKLLYVRQSQIRKLSSSCCYFLPSSSLSF